MQEFCTKQMRPPYPLQSLESQTRFGLDSVRSVYSQSSVDLHLFVGEKNWICSNVTAIEDLYC